MNLVPAVLKLSTRYDSGAFDRFAQGLTAPGAARDVDVAASPRAEGESWPLSSGSYGSELYEFLTNGFSSAGVAVTERTAMMVSTVYACVGLIGGAIMSLPAHIYRRTEDGPERIDHDVWWLLNEQAWSNWTAAAFWQHMAWSRLLHGDAFALIHRNRGGDIRGFEPLHPDGVDVTRVRGESGDTRLMYRIAIPGPNGELRGLIRDQDDMIHVTGPGFDGERSPSTLRYALRHAVGVALAADEYAARFFRNGARPDFAIEWPGKLDDGAKTLLRESWTQTFGGPFKAHTPAILTSGAKLHPLDMKPEETQLLATRRFQVEDICRVYGVPPHMVASTEKVTSWGSGIEQLSIGFVKYTLGRHLVAIEQEFNRKCFLRPSPFMEFSTAGLERGDFKSRNEAYRTALGRAGEAAWMTVNEVRRLENMRPVSGGDELRRADAVAAEPAPAAPEDPEPTQTEKALALMAGAVAVIAAREPAAPVLNVTPAPVNVNVGETNVAAPVVNVAPAAAPNVQLEAQIVNPPAQLIVNNVSRTTEQQIEHNDKGEMTRIVTRDLAQEPVNG